MDGRHTSDTLVSILHNRFSLNIFALEFKHNKIQSPRLLLYIDIYIYPMFKLSQKTLILIFLLLTNLVRSLICNLGETIQYLFATMHFKF